MLSVPGIILEGWASLILLFADGDNDRVLLNSSMFFNFALYFLAVYFAVWLFHYVNKSRSKNELVNHNRNLELKL